MKKIFLITLFITFLLNKSFSQTPLTGIINTYAKVIAVDSAGGEIIIQDIDGADDAFQTNRQVIIIQMKGATVDLNGSSSAFGTINNLGNAGKYEVATILQRSGTGPYTLTMTQHLARNYDAAGYVQVISFPKYENVIISGNLTALPWNEANGYGGVLALQVNSLLTLAGNIDVSQAGFRGGVPNINSNGGNTDNTTFGANINSGHAGKGEGIAVFSSGLEWGRGAFANGGGGGNVHNAGGGGGGNLTPGGQGGEAWPDAAGDDGGNGVGGNSLTYNPAMNRIFMGGGGGGGQQNNSAATSGGAGGGIVILRANTVTTDCGARSILANGQSALSTNSNDAAGGGGGGGTLLIDVVAFNLSCDLTISASGGNGGSISHTIPHGAGGGGGIGAILLSTNSGNSFTKFESTPGNPGNDCINCGITGQTGGICASNCNGEGWTIPGEVTPLPIVDLKFMLNETDGKLQLDWSVGDEVGISFFIIERKDERETVISIKEVPAGEMEDYSVILEKPLTEISHYRIKAVYSNGQEQFSEWHTYRLGNLSLMFYPNPAIDKITFRGKEYENNKRIEVVTLSGKTIFETHCKDEAIFDRSRIGRGVYYLKVITKEKIIWDQIIIE